MVFVLLLILAICLKEIGFSKVPVHSLYCNFNRKKNKMQTNNIQLYQPMITNILKQLVNTES